MVELPEERVQFRVRKTVLEMLDDRGYDTGNVELEEDFDVFKARFEENGPMNIITYTKQSKVDELGPDAKVEPIYVHFMTKDSGKIDKEFITRIVRFMDEWSTKSKEEEDCAPLTNAIIVACETQITSVTKKNMAEITPFRIEVFDQRTLLFNITKHEMVPKHSIITKEDKAALLKKYRINDSQLPKIMVDDPVARYYGARKGDVIKIIRPSDTAGRYVTYRVTVPGL